MLTCPAGALKPPYFFPESHDPGDLFRPDGTKYRRGQNVYMITLYGMSKMFLCCACTVGLGLVYRRLTAIPAP